MRIIGNDPNKPRQTAATASGTLPNGKPVVVNADGTVSVVSETAAGFGSESIFESATISQPGSVYDPANDKLVVFYRDQGNSYYGTAVVGSISGSTITFGSPVVFQSANSQYSAPIYDSTTSQIVNYYSRDPDNYGMAVIGTVSGTSISFGTPVVHTSQEIRTVGAAFYTNSSIICYRNESASNFLKGKSGQISGGSISFGSEESLYGSAITGRGAVVKGENNAGGTRAICVFDTNSEARSVSLIAQGTSLFAYSTTQFLSNTTNGISAVFDDNAKKFVIVYSDASDSYHIKAVVGELSGTTASYGTAVTAFAGTSYHSSAAFDTSSNKVIVSYINSSNVINVVEGEVSGNSISFGTATASSSTTSDTFTSIYDPDSNKTLLSFRDSGNSNYGTSMAYAAGSTNLTAENYIGMSQGPVQVFAEGAGSLVEYHSTDTRGNNIAYDAASGKFVAIFNPGPPTSSPPAGYAIVGTVDPSDNSITYGTPVQFESGEVYGDQMGITYDSNAEKVVIAYKNSATNVAYGIVGTVSGTSISFGSPTTFNNNCQFITAAFDSTNNKVVIVYKDNSNLDYGTAIVGTVSGTSISFGTKAVFNSGNTSYVNLCFDSTNSKIIIGYRDQAFQQQATCVVGTVSGTSISFGSEVTVSPNSATHTVPIYDPVAEKVVFVYTDSSDSDKGKVKIGTVSGTSISFGSEVTFESNVAEQSAGVFDTNAGKVNIAYKSGPSGYPQIISGTVSGSTMTFGDAVQLGSFAAAGYRFGCAYDSSTFRTVSVFIDSDATPDTGESAVFNNFYEVRPSIADGGNALLDTQGGVSENQSSLTAGQSYYVQTDGTLSTTAGDPSVFAGTAVSSTKLIVKG